ncbi:MAG: GNAT family N-acetyltransferase, partial [Minisyncoccia bacterium]
MPDYQITTLRTIGHQLEVESKSKLIEEITNLLNERFEHKVDRGRRVSETVEAALEQNGRTSLLLAVQDMKVVGILTVTFVPDFDYDFAHWRNLVVNKEYEGNGVARALLDSARMMGKQRGMEMACLAIDHDAPEHVRKFYRGLGFEADASEAHHLY